MNCVHIRYTYWDEKTCNFRECRKYSISAMSKVLKIARRRVPELGIEYNAKKNSIGVCVKKNQSVNVHYVPKNDVFKFIWSNTEINERDKTYIFGKYPVLEEILYVVCDFRDIYVKKDAQLLENFIGKYSNCSMCSIKSFASGRTQFSVDKSLSFFD